MLAEIIKHFIKNKLEQLISDPASEQRIEFSGPSNFILKDLFESFEDEGELSTLLIEGQELSFPVFLVDSKAKFYDQVFTSKRTPNNVVKVRNSKHHPTFVTIVPSSESLNLSIESTVTSIGYNSRKLTNFENWKNNDLVSFILKELVRPFISGDDTNGEKVTKILVACLNKIWEANESQIDRKEIWNVLKSLSKCYKKADKNEFLAVLGVPLGTDHDNVNEALKIVKKISELFDEQGFRGATDYIKENVDANVLSDYSQYIENFRDHITSKCRYPGDFVTKPLNVYSPKFFKSEESTDLPEWWHVLNLQEWIKILSQTSSNDQDFLKVELLDKLNTPKGTSDCSLLEPHFQFVFNSDENANSAEERQLSISRSVGNQAPEFLETILISESDSYWRDLNPPKHSRLLRYLFEASNMAPKKYPVISLMSFEPGILLNCYTAEKISPFKWTAKGTVPGAVGKKRSQYECDMHLRSTGIHDIRLYVSSALELDIDEVIGFEVDNEGGKEKTKFIQENETTYTVRVVSDDECKYQFKALNRETGDHLWYVINITAGDNEPHGVRSEFERLIFQNVDTASGRSPQIVPDRSLLAQYFDWALHSETSFNPVIFGEDVKTSWKMPEWHSMDTISEYRTQNDPRPSLSDFSPPPPLIKIRNELLQQIRVHCENKEKEISVVEFSKLAKSEEFSKALEDYLYEYQNWLSDDYKNAIWFESITFHKKEPNSQALSDKPTALILSPLHPLKIAWQVNAQTILDEALSKGVPCPAASQINGDHFPRCISLSTNSVLSNSRNEVGYFSVGSSSDYWSVLWNSNQTEDLADNNILEIFSKVLGLNLQGLTTGFTSSQMIQSLDEMLLQNPAKSHFKVIVASGTNSESYCTEGILDWCNTKLGKECDEWSAASPTRLEILDKRNISQVPEPSLLAELTKKCDASVAWASVSSKTTSQEKPGADLAALAHISLANITFGPREDLYRSGVDKSLTFRYDLKAPASPKAISTVTKSMIGLFPITIDQTQLQKLLSRSLSEVESKCSDIFEYMSFSPDTAELKSSLKDAEFCAVSSASLDQTCFADLTEDSYLWHYELPDYSKSVTDNSGYFLMASLSERMLYAISSALKMLNPNQNFEKDTLKEILKQISLRGIPTLKNITSGGTSAFGEVGLLSAVKHLQFSLGLDDSGLIPIQDKEKKSINLIIPSDTFHRRYDRLRQLLEGSISGKRPDLIVASILFDNFEKPLAIKITPVEVKTREDNHTAKQQEEALKQAREFSKFLINLREESKSTEIWRLAWRDLLAGWVEYGFKIIGQDQAKIEGSDWLYKQTSTISQILKGEIEIFIDEDCRLISISKKISGHSSLSNNVLDLTKEDAAKIFSGESNIVHSFCKRSDLYWNTRVDINDLADGATGTPEETSLTGPDQDTDEPEIKPSNPEVPNDTPSDEGSNIEPGGEPVEQGEGESRSTEESTGIKFKVGHSIDDLSNREIEFFPSNTSLNNLNMGIVGDLGTGKTQLTQALIYNLVKDPSQNRGHKPNFLILDYKKDYSKDEFVKKTGARVYAPKNLPLNPLSTRGTETGWLNRALFFNDLLEKIETRVGPVQKQNVKGAIKEVFEENLGNSDPTIPEVFERYKVKVDGKVDIAWAVMSDFVDGEHFETDQNKIIPFKEFLDGVVVIDLSQLGQNDQAKNMIVALFLNLFYEYMLKIEKQPFLGTEPSLRFIDSFLLVDEADKIMKYDFPILRNLLSEGREFGVGVILASQYLSHFKTSGSKGMDYKEPLLTWFLHKVPNIADRELRELGIQNEHLASRIPQLELHQCLCKTLDCPGELIYGTPFYKLD